MEQDSFRALLRRTVAIPVIALIILATVLLWEIQSLNSSLQWVDHTDQVIGASQQLMKLLIDMESGVRGYLSSGSDEFLQPYNEAQPSIDPKFAALNQLIADNLPQQTRLATLRSRFDEWQSYQAARIALRRNTGARLEPSLQGKQLMDSVRAEHGAFIAAEERLRAERVRRAQNAARLLTVTCVLLTLGIGGFLAILTRRQMHRLASDFQNSLDIAEKRAEALRESEQQFETLANAIPQLAWMANPDGWIFWYNQRWYEYTGTTPEQMEGWAWQSVHNPETLPKVMAQWKASITSGEPFDMVFPLRGADGVFRPFLTRVMPVKDAEGKVVRWFGTNTDISAQMKAEEDSKNSFVTLSNFVPQLVWMCTPDGLNVYFNQRWVDYTGLTLEESYGRGWNTPFHPDDQQPAWNAWNKAVQTGGQYSVECRLRAADGSYRRFLIRGEPMRDLSGAVVRWLGTCTDVEELRQESEQLLRTVTENSHVGLVLLSADRRYLYANAAYAEVLGLRTPDIVGKRVPDVMGHVYDQISPRLDRAFAGERVNYELKAPVRQGAGDEARDRFYAITYEPLPGHGKDTRVIAVVVDITERKQAEEALRSSQARLQGVVGSAMDAIVSVDEQQRIVVFNRAAETIFQCAASEAIGSTLDRFIPKSLREVHREHIERFGSEGISARSMTSPAVLFGLRANGEEFPIEATISQVQAGGEKLYTVILRDITERKRAEEARTRLATIVETAGDAIISKDLDGMVLSWNQSAERLFGYTAQEIIGQPITLIIPPDRDGEEAAFLERLRRGGDVDHYETVRMDKSGRRIDVSVTLSPIRDASGAVVGVSKTARDITERKQAEEALRESLERLERVLEVETVGVMFWDLNTGCMVDANNTFLKNMGYSRSDIEERRLTWQKLTPPEYFDMSRAEVEKFMVTGRVGPYEKEYFRKDGTRQWLLFAGSSLGNNQCVEFCVDISDRKKAEEALRSTEQRWATTLQSIGDAVISTDEVGNIDFMNEVAERLTGWPLPEAKGTHLSSVFNILQEVTRIIPESPVDKVLRLGKVVGLANHTMLISRDGSEIPIEDSAAPIRDRGGRIEGVVLVFHDVLERRKTEKALRISDRLATTGRLAATIAHEIHNPLDAISNLLYLIGQSTQDDVTREYASTASHELVRITQMTQRMLAFQREAAKPVPVKISEILESVTALYERKIKSANINLKQQIDFDGYILALPGELRQMFANLVGNAIEAVTPSRGTITVRAYTSRDWRRQRPGLRVVVADDGPGIPVGVRTSIFEPFFTTKGESGTGLGLWITSEILRKYDGTLHLRSSTQPHLSGACFSVFLPFDTVGDQAALSNPR